MFLHLSAILFTRGGRGVSVKGEVSVQGGLWPGDFCQGGSLQGRSLSSGGYLAYLAIRLKSGRYVSHCNAFLFFSVQSRALCKKKTQRRASSYFSLFLQFFSETYDKMPENSGG